MKQPLTGSAAWALLITAAAAVLGAAPPRPRVFCLSPQALALAKTHVAATDETLRPALEKLRKDAQSTLKAGPFSVVDQRALEKLPAKQVAESRGQLIYNSYRGK